MALSLPFFKFDVIAWLTSERIAFMHAQHIGAYIMLLAQCWTQDTCTLPNDLSQLKTWSRWKDEEHGDFTPVLACFEPYKKTGRLTNPRLYREWQDAKQSRVVLSESGQRGALKRWAEKPMARKKRTPESAPARDWLAELKANPLYAHVNFDLELEGMQRWKLKPKNKNRQINESFVINWVNKIDKPLSNGHGTSLTCPHHPTLTFPDQAALKTHNFSYHPIFKG